MGPQNLWAKLVSLNPDKESVNFDTKSNQFSVEGKWRIEKKSAGDTWIINISSGYLKIGENWLEKDQEKQLFGGEMIAFSQNKEKSPKFDYVFCFMDIHSQNELKRSRQDECFESSNQANQKLLKIDDVIQEETVCSICLGILSRCATVNPCGHNFCGGCLIDHLKNSLSCPLCKSQVISVTKNSAFHNIIEAAAKNSAHLRKRDNQIARIQNDLEGNVNKIGRSIFIGSLLNGKKEGQGTLACTVDGVCPADVIFQGVWKNNLLEGEGVLIFKDGTIIINGVWLGDRIQPHVRIKYASGNLYQGEAKNFKHHGKGILKLGNGDVYEGDFKEGLQEGFGKYYYKNGNEYEGDWIQGRKEGLGTMKYFGGAVYKGEWRNNKREGNGILTHKNGDKFEGTFRNDFINGTGKYSWAKGEEYEGNFTDFHRNGNGTMKYLNGDIYKGEWQMNKKHGKGVYIRMNGDKIEGDWIENILQPLVKIEYPNGDRYEGEIQTQTFQKHGKGVLFFSNGTQYDGHWLNNKETGQGKYILEYADRKYEEVWKEGMIHDSSVTFANGTKFQATWKEVKEVEGEKVKGRKKKKKLQIE